MLHIDVISFIFIHRKFLRWFARLKSTSDLIELLSRWHRVHVHVCVCVCVTCAPIDDAVYQRLTVWHWAREDAGGAWNTIRRQHLAWTIYFSGRPSASRSSRRRSRWHTGGSGMRWEGVSNLLYTYHEEGKPVVDAGKLYYV